jgi:hypothetical protein
VARLYLRAAKEQDCGMTKALTLASSNTFSWCHDTSVRYTRAMVGQSVVFAGQAIAQRQEPLGGTGFWINSVFWISTVLLSLIAAGLFLIVTGIMYLNRSSR